jgi:hypothetical protein
MGIKNFCTQNDKFLMSCVLSGMAARGGGWPGSAEALHVSFSRFTYTDVDLKPDHSQEIELKGGREVSRGDGNLVSIEYGVVYFI